MVAHAAGIFSKKRWLASKFLDKKLLYFVLKAFIVGVFRGVHIAIKEGVTLNMLGS